MSFIKKEIITKRSKKETPIALPKVVPSKKKATASFKIDSATKNIIANIGFAESDIRDYIPAKISENTNCLLYTGELNKLESKYLELRISTDSNFSVRYMVYNKDFDTYISFTKELNSLYMIKEGSPKRTKEKWQKIKEDFNKSYVKVKDMLAYMDDHRTTEETAIKLVKLIGEKYLELTVINHENRNKKKDDYGDVIVTVLSLAKNFNLRDLYYALFAVYTEGSNDAKITGVNAEGKDFSYSSASGNKQRDKVMRDFINTIFFKNLMEDYYKNGGQPFKVSNFTR